MLIARTVISLFSLNVAGAMFFSTLPARGAAARRDDAPRVASADSRRDDAPSAHRTRASSAHAPRAQSSNDAPSGRKRASAAATKAQNKAVEQPVKSADRRSADAPSSDTRSAETRSSDIRVPDAQGTESRRAVAVPGSRVARTRSTDAADKSGSQSSADSAAKLPTAAPSSAKSSVEKFAAEKTNGEKLSAVEKLGAEKLAPETQPGDVAETTRSVDLTTAARRDGATTALVPGAPQSARPVTVSIEGPVFDNGEVPRAAASLERMKNALSRCAQAESALTKNEGTIDVRFLVRAPGRAEGVDVEKARGVSGDVVRCVTAVLARSYIGAPSDDPVGVAVTVRVRKD